MHTAIKTIDYHDTWPIRHRVMWPDKPEDYVRLDDDPKGTHLGLFAGGELVSVISVFVDNREAQFRKFATLKHQQGKGYGSKLLEHLINRMQAAGVKRLWCNARVEKCELYQGFGLQKTASRFSKGGKDYLIMELIFEPESLIQANTDRNETKSSI